MRVTMILKISIIVILRERSISISPQMPTNSARKTQLPCSLSSNSRWWWKTVQTRSNSQ